MRSLLVFLAALALAAPARPCTTFCLARNGEVLYGRNYDFEIGQGYVMTNRRGVQKTSMAGTLRWTSRYASVTFNQWGREFPMDGMNESGLVVALMWLDETVYPVDARPSLRVLEWIQYQLDNHGTVSELLAHVDETRIGGGTPLHYLVADATGDVATIEYLEGALVVHRGDSLTAPVLANDSYERASSFLRQFMGFGGSRSMPRTTTSLDRFARAAMLLRSSDASVDGAFSILTSVAQPGGTRWSVVYDTRRHEIWWVSDRNRDRKQVRMDALGLDCSAEEKMLDVHSAMSGDVTDRLERYSSARNRELVVSAYAQTSFTRSQPARFAEADAEHAESFSCAGPRRRSVGR
jgi:choloylglycine hydrolase